MHHAHETAQASAVATTDEVAHLLLHHKFHDICSSTVHGALFVLAGSTTGLIEELGGMLHGQANKLALHVSTASTSAVTAATTHHIGEHLKDMSRREGD